MTTIRNTGLVAMCVAGALMSTAALAVDPYQKPDDTWISIDGTVKSVSANAFVLNYGDGTITVEMDDGDRDADGYKLIDGDKVTVYGKIDDDFYELTTIEAGSVYVENIGTYFYASSADEEDVDTFVTMTVPVSVSRTVVQGTVSDVDDDEFTIDTGVRELRVEVDEMAYNPLDDEGYQKIEPGNRVSVIGEMDDDLFEGRKLEADSVITLDR